jgi:carboxyl-terminal processing protease
LKIKKTYWPLVLFSALAFGVWVGGLITNYTHTGSTGTGASPKSKIHKLIEFIEREYVDEINTDSIVDVTVSEILERLDPHSVYISQTEFNQVAESMRGDFVGIGVNFYMYKDTVAVIKPVLGGPSEKAGIRSGDRILFADNHQLFGKNLPNDSLFGKLKGQVGSEVTLTMYRKSENLKWKVKLRRDLIPIKSVDVALMISPEVGYIKVNRFAETTYKEFQKGLKRLIEEGAKSMVIDVRDNGGGYLDKAVQIADEFLGSEEIVVFTKNKKGRMDKTKATSKGSFEKGNVVVLINENSASASEILAGAIQDNDRGVIVGRRSFGKGLVQREMPLGDGSAVRLTVARYYTPSGRSIQKPYINGNSGDYFSEFERRYQNGELYEKDSIKVADSLKFKTVKGRTVYGGGGIVPDHFVPLSGKHGEEALDILLQSGLMSYFVFEQLDKNRKEFSNISTEQLIQKMENTEMYFSAFQKYLNDTGMTFRLEKYKPLVNNHLLAEFARQLIDEETYFSILLKEDPMIQKLMSLEP